MELRAGTGTRGSLGEEAGAIELWGSLSMGAEFYWGKRPWKEGQGLKGIHPFFSLNYVQTGNDSQALSSGPFPLAGTRPGI